MHPSRLLPRSKGVVIGTNLFSRAVKKKSGRNSANAQLPVLDEEYEEKQNELCEIMVGKMRTLLEGQESAGVKDFIGDYIVPEGSGFEKCGTSVP